MVRTRALVVALFVVAVACTADSASDGGPSTTEGGATSTVVTDSADTATTEAASTGESSTTAGSDTTGADGVGDSFYPTLGNGGYDVSNYGLVFDIDAEANTIEAAATINASATQTLDRFNLDFSGLEVESVTVDGADAAFAREGTELIVTPATTVASGAEFVTVVIYSGSPEPINDPAVPFTVVGWQKMAGTIFTASEPTGSMSFFPSNNHPTDKATFDITITADESLTSAATGVLVDESTADGRTTTTWRMDDPMATYLAAVYLGDFERRETTGPDGLSIRNYFPTADADELAEAFDPVTADAIEFYADLFGAPYPFDAYGSIVLPFRTGYALENQTLSVHGRDATDSTVIAHEIMHQWTGNSVTVSSWQDIWLLEGLATYLTFMYHEDRGLPTFATPPTLYGLLDPGTSVGAAEVDVRNTFSPDVYFRGALGLHALRLEMGDDTFRTIMSEYYGRHVGGDASTADFRDIVSEFGGDDALAALDPWLFGPLPDEPTG